jgi:hypothetical protein
MPSLGGATGWLNSEPVGPAELRGHVMLVDFWTLTCINWLRTEPHVRGRSQAYRGDGLVVIGAPHAGVLVRCTGSTACGGRSRCGESTYEAGRAFPAEQFSLSEQANRDLAALCRALEVDADQVTVHFGREAVEEATKLGAAHHSESGLQSLIVGGDVAAQLAGDHQRPAEGPPRPAASRARVRAPGPAAPRPRRPGQRGAARRGGAGRATPGRAGDARARPGGGGCFQRRARRRGGQVAQPAAGRQARGRDPRRRRSARRAGQDRATWRGLRVPRLGRALRDQDGQAQARVPRQRRGAGQGPRLPAGSLQHGRARAAAWRCA